MNARIPTFAPRARKNPYPHQFEALSGIRDALSVADRAKVIQACGTGKTLTALWAVEQAQARTAIVLVPTLALMAQTFREWRAENNFPHGFRHICVCSDRSVDVDDVAFNEDEQREYRACTDAMSVRAFLDGAAAAPYGEAPVSVVFCTYQSAWVVGEAFHGAEGLPAPAAMEIAILDEGHKTVGREGKRNAFALLDANLPIHKRLFFTATEKLVEQVRSADEASEARVLSMDNEALYGRTAYRLGFMQAARRGLIAPFQVVGSFVNDAMLGAKELASPDAKRTADIRSLQHAMRTVNARKAITFHHRVQDAQDFAAGVRGVPTFHVNGEQSTFERQAVLAAFASAAEGIMTNARCLTEGIDVPSVDMVAFMDPRQSSTDIVQIAGRALRLSPGKVLGYVFVPLHVDVASGETVEQAIARGDFRQIMTVLQSLTENDGVPKPWATRLRDALEVGDSAAAAPLLRLVAEGPCDLDVERIVAALSARILHFSRSSFDVDIERLRAFKDEHGHCNVPRNYPGGLGAWVSRQRIAGCRPGYPEDRRAQLDALGFVWKLRDTLLETGWTKRIGQLAAFHRKYGHCNVPTDFPNGLGGWVSRQRMDSRRPDYPAHRRAQLDAMGFCWDLRESEWAIRIEQLTAFRLEHGHCNVPVGYLGGLGAWAHIQRRDAKRLTYAEARRAQLNGLGFVWSAYDVRWSDRFEQLTAFHRKHGHCNAPTRSGLGRWLQSQRDLAKRPGYPEERRAQLDALGFVWNPRSIPEGAKLAIEPTQIARDLEEQQPLKHRDETNGLPEEEARENRPWMGVDRITLAPLVELRRSHRKARKLQPETGRQIATLLSGEFARLKDMELIRFDHLDEECSAELIHLASEFAGVSIAIHPDSNDHSTEEVEEWERPRG